MTRPSLIRRAACAWLLLLASALAQTSSWRGTVSTAWRTADNWTAGVPNAGIDAVIGDAHFTGPFQPTISAAAACRSLLLGAGVVTSTLTVTRNLTVSGNITIGARGRISHSGRTIALTGSWTNEGVYVGSAAGATVRFEGSTQTISGATAFRTLTIAAGSRTTLKSDIIVSNVVTVAGTLDPDENPTRRVSGVGALSVSAGGVLMVKATNFAGNYALSGTRTLNVDSTVDYAAATVNQIVDNTLTYSTLRISGGLTKTLAGNLPALNSSSASAGNIQVVAGTLDLSTFTANRGTTVAGGMLTVANGATLRIGGTNTFPANYATRSLGPSSTVEYAGGNQAVSLETYGHLTLASSGGAVTKTLPAGAMTVAGNLTSSVGAGTSVTFTAGGALTVNGHVSLGAATTFNGGSFAHTVGGDWINAGTYNGGTGTVTMSGASASISGAGVNQFNHLVISGAGVTAASNTNLEVSGDLATTGAGTFTHLPGPGTLTMSGASRALRGTGISLNNFKVTGSITTSNSIAMAGHLEVGGSLAATAGTWTLNGTGKTISGAGSISLHALNVPGSISSSASFSLKSDLSVGGSLSAGAGTVTFAGSSTLSGTANLFHVTLNGTRLQLGPGSALGIGGSFAITAGSFDVTNTTPNTVLYYADAAQTVLATTYDHLTFSGAGIKTAGGPLVVNNNLTILPGATFSAGAFTHSLYGDWINQGSFAAGTGTNVFRGLDTVIAGTTTFHAVEIRKDSASHAVTLQDSIRVAALNMAVGRMLTGANVVTITVDRTGPGIILGTITRAHPFLPGVPYAFEGPDNTILFPSSAGGATSITVRVAVGPVSDFPFGACVNRQYEVSLSGAGAYEATLRLHYEDEELNGNSESDMQFWYYTDSWAPAGKTGHHATSNWVELAGLTDLTGRWTLSDDFNVVRWNGAVSAAWETPGNWTVLQGNPGRPPTSNDIVEIGSAGFAHPPVITSPAAARTLSFGSVQAAALTIGPGGSLRTEGNIGGVWSTDAEHAIFVGAQTLAVGGDLVLSDGATGRVIHLNIDSGAVTVSGSLTQSGGANLTFSGPGTLNLGGDFVYVSGTFMPGGGTVRYHGSAAQIVAGGITYNHLVVDKPSGTATLSTNAVVHGHLSVTNGRTLLVTAPLAVAGDVLIGTGATLHGGATTLSVGGHWTAFGAFASGAGTVVFNGAGVQHITAATFNNLTIDKASGAAVLAANLALNGDLHVSAGTFDLSTFTANRNVAGGTLALASGATLKIGTGSSFPGNFATRALAADSTVEYNGTDAQSVAAETYGHLTFTAGGRVAKTLAGATTVAGNLFINDGATFDAGPFALNVQGNWTNRGVFLPSSGSVTLSGESKNIGGSNTFNHLTVSGSYAAHSNNTVVGTMNISGTYDARGAPHFFAGNFFNAGTFFSSGTVVFAGTAPQTLALNGGFVSSGAVRFDGTAAPVFAGATSPTFHDVVIHNTAGVSPEVGWSVNGSLVVAAGAAFHGGPATHTLYGSFTNNGVVTSSGTLSFVPAHAVTLQLLGASFASSGTVVFGGTGPITLAGGAPAFRDVILLNSHAAGMTPVSNWSVSGNLSIGAEAILYGGSGLTHTLSGDLVNHGVFDGAGSTVILNGTTKIAGSGSTTFRHLTIAGTATASADFNVAGHFTNNGNFDATGATVTFVGPSSSTIGGSTAPTPFDALTIEKDDAVVTLAVPLSDLTALTISRGTLDTSIFSITQDPAGGTLSIAGGAALKIGGTNTLPVFSTCLLNADSTVEYNGTGAQVIAAQNYGHLTSSSSGARTLPAAGTIGIAGAFTPGTNAYTITGSTINYNGAGPQTVAAFNYYNLISSSTGPRTLASVGTIGVAGSFTPGANTYAVAGSTLHFNGGAQIVPAFTYYHLTAGGTGLKTLGGPVTVQGTLTIAGGGLADGGFTATVNGDVVNSVRHTGTGRILLAGGSVAHVLHGTGAYSRIELNDPAGATLAADLTVSNVLILTTGRLSATTHKVVIGATAAVSRVAGYVWGRLQKPVPTGHPVRMFEVGGASRYAPVSLLFTNVTAAGTVTAWTTDGDHPNVAAAGIHPNLSVNRYWTLTNSGAVFARVHATLEFTAEDMDPGAAWTNFSVAVSTGGVWFLPAIGFRTATNIQALAVTNLGDFVVGVRQDYFLAITNTPPGVRLPFSATSKEVSGVARGLVGTLYYTNAHAGGIEAGSLPATSNWSFTVRLPKHGLYTVLIGGTNEFGLPAADSVTFRRNRNQVFITTPP